MKKGLSSIMNNNFGALILVIILLSMCVLIGILIRRTEKKSNEHFANSIAKKAGLGIAIYFLIMFVIILISYIAAYIRLKKLKLL
jgi:hypothetical protein